MNSQELKTTSINTIMLGILTIAKMIFPLLLLPYLTRVLTVETYGMVSYVKAVMAYVQLCIDFGFIYSAVKEIVLAKDNKESINHILSNTILGKLVLSGASVVVVFILCFSIPTLRGNILYTFLCLIVPILSSFLVDFFFRGIEKMHYITIVFVVMKIISTILTVLFVHSDNEILLIPLFDILSSLLAVLMSWIIVYKLGYRIVKPNIKEALKSIKHSFSFFINSFASTAFGAFITIMIGLFIPDLKEIAYWSVSMQLVGAVQSLYTPISNGIYPYMIKNKSLKLIRLILLIFMPVVVCGCVFCYFMAPWILKIMSGEEYVSSAYLFRLLIPVLLISFPVAILGWPIFGPIDKQKEMSISTIIGAALQVIIIFVLIFANCFNLVSIAISRSISELGMLIARIVYCQKFKGLFAQEKTTSVEGG